MKKLNLAILSTISVGLLSVANAQMKTDDQVEFRKATYKFMALNVGRIKANLDGNFDANAVKTAANAISAAANTKPEVLFGDGSDKHSSLKVRAKADIWVKKADFDKLANDLQMRASDLVAAGADKDKVAKAFGDLNKTCKTCHDAFRE